MAPIIKFSAVYMDHLKTEKVFVIVGNFFFFSSICEGDTNGAVPWHGKCVGCMRGFESYISLFFFLLIDKQYNKVMKEKML